MPQHNWVEQTAERLPPARIPLPLGRRQRCELVFPDWGFYEPASRRCVFVVVDGVVDGIVEVLRITVVSGGEANQAAAPSADRPARHRSGVTTT
jgi:hypothetical protein